MRNKTRIAIGSLMILLCLGMLRWADAGGQYLKKEDVPKAISMLKQGAPKQRIWAAEEIGKLGAIRITYVKDAIEPLKEALQKDADPKVRAAAARALGKIAPEPKTTVNLLLDVLKNDKSTPVKIAVMTAIGELGSAGRVAIPEIRKIARDKDNKQLSQTARMVLKSLQMK